MVLYKYLKPERLDVLQNCLMAVTPPLLFTIRLRQSPFSPPTRQRRSRFTRRPSEDAAISQRKRKPHCRRKSTQYKMITAREGSRGSRR